MSLLRTLTDFCADKFYKYGDCTHCSHPSGKCSGSCLVCSEEVNFHHTNGRKDYDCQKFLYYYVCRYSWKYCSEIMYALEHTDFTEYPACNILSLGCGGAPDLMAFEERMPIIKDDTIQISYSGYDANPYWTPIHEKIEEYVQQLPNITAQFYNRDIFEVLSSNENLSACSYNILVLEYLLSHFPPDKREYLSDKLFDKLIEVVLPNRLKNSPFLFIINDINYKEVCPCFDTLLEKLNRAGYDVSYKKFHFNNDKQINYNDGSTLYLLNQNKFSIPDEIKNDFNCAIKCSSAQLRVEVS